MGRLVSLLYIALTALPVVRGGFTVTTDLLPRPATSSTGNNTRLITILVGGPTLTFTPNSVVAQPGDVLQFQFGARNHTVTQSTQFTPCQPFANGGVNSGFIPFDGGASGTVGTFDVPVMDTQPMWLYCAQATHCQSGMVMAINAPSSLELIAYALLASAQAQNVPAAGVAGGIAASIPLANAIVPKVSSPGTASGSRQTLMTMPPAATVTAIATGAPREGGTATVFTTVVVGPSGLAAGNTTVNSTVKSTSRPAQVTGGGMATAGLNGSLSNGAQPSRVPFTGAGHRLGHKGELVSVVVNAAAVALGIFLFIVRP